jgi:hypothetical protein
MVNTSLNHNFTVESVRAGDCANLTPEFVRVPVCQALFGIKRGILFRWIGEGRIKTVLIREPGNKQGMGISYSADEVMLSNSIWNPANLNRVSDTLVTG